MVGVKETYDVLSLVAQLGTAISKATADGKLSLLDAPLFVGSLRAAVEAYANIAKVPAELKDLDATEKEYLVAKFKEELDLENDAVEAFVEKGVEALAKLHDVLSMFYTPA